MNLLFTMYLLNFRASQSASVVRMQILTDTCVQLMFVQLFLFTDFHNNPSALLHQSFMYISGFIFVIVVNIGFLLK